MKREHTRCLFDICNFYGWNGGAWADLFGDDLIVFAGMWHGNSTDRLKPHGDDASPCLWLPGAGPSEREVSRLANGKVYMDVDYHSSIRFGALGDVSRLIKRFDADELPEPQDFAGCDLLSTAELNELPEDG